MNSITNLLRGWMLEALQNRIIVNTKDGSVMVFVEEGNFVMGDDLDHDTPQHQVHLSGFWIGIYCVTGAQFENFLRTTNYKLIRPKSLCKPVFLGQREHPVVCVKWEDAQAYAEWAGCALPTEAQWEKAARGPQGFLYPWGNTWDARRCRCRIGNDKITNCRAYDYPNGVSGYGTYNQSGNVLEWCADWYDPNYYKNCDSHLTTNPTGPNNGTYRVVRGGSRNYQESQFFRATYRYWHDPHFCRDSLGFRIVYSANK